MPTVIQGTFNLGQVLNFTRNKFRSRFDYYERDIVKGQVQIALVRTYTPDRRNQPTVKYQITTKSYPQYRPYYTGKDRRGRSITYQRTWAHYYDAVLQMDRLSFSTVNWKYRLGTGRKWQGKKPPQSQVDTIYIENLRRWSKSQIQRHRRTRHKYRSVGDYIAREIGVNLDWQVRAAHAYKIHGHLFGKVYGADDPAQDNPLNIVFAPKHMIALLNALAKNGRMTVD